MNIKIFHWIFNFLLGLLLFFVGFTYFPRHWRIVGSQVMVHQIQSADLPMIIESNASLA